jgi:hypothetical protein
MAIRLGMTDLIQQLRQMAQADIAEYTLGSETYWADTHLQAILDRHRMDTHQETVWPTEVFENGNTVYRDYYWQYGNVEQLSSGSAIWQLRDTDGVSVGTADYTVDYSNRHIQFGTATDGSSYLLSYRVYDLYRSAAEVWRLKAANVASNFDLATDNHDLKRSQKIKHYLQMAEQFERLAQGGSGSNPFGAGRMVKLRRVDVENG